MEKRAWYVDQHDSADLAGGRKELVLRRYSDCTSRSDCMMYLHWLSVSTLGGFDPSARRRSMLKSRGHATLPFWEEAVSLGNTKRRRRRSIISDYEFHLISVILRL